MMRVRAMGRLKMVAFVFIALENQEVLGLLYQGRPAIVMKNFLQQK